MDVKSAQKIALEENLPFYSYRLPNSENPVFGLQTGGRSSKGFLVHPFKESEETPEIIIKGDFFFIGSTEKSFPHKTQNICKRRNHSVIVDDRKEYFRQFEKISEAFRSGLVDKAVLSRIITEKCEALDLAPLWFEKLSLHYPEAFIFLINVPETVTWMGASPELFLKQDDSGAETMALAATRPAGQKGDWGGKEKEEQRIVSGYISGILKKYGNWIMSGTYTKAAGNVEHICNIFHHDGKLPSAMVDAVRKELHPTPAVGGFPKEKALKLIEEVECRSRRYYAGYLGPLDDDLDFQMYVNLRSMEIFPEAVNIYVGGGITPMSDPEKEWRETEIKSRTLLNIIS